MTILFAISLVAVLGITGLAIDYSSALRHEARMQDALDAAVLAAAKNIVPDTGGDGGQVSPEGQEQLNTIFNENFRHKVLANGNDALPYVDARFGADGSISATATMPMKTLLMGLLGFDGMTISVKSEASAHLGFTDIALALDNTGSMSGAKLDGLRDATARLVDAVYSKPSAEELVRIGLVPFSQYVNVGTTYAGASWLGDTSEWRRNSNYCVDAVEPIYGTDCQTITETRYNDGVPYDYSYQSCDVIGQKTVPVCNDFDEFTRWDGCVGSRDVPLDLQDEVQSDSRVPPMMQAYIQFKGDEEQLAGTVVQCVSPLSRLSSERSTIDAAIGEMRAVGETYIPSGLLWGWRLLSSKAPFADSGKSKDGKVVNRILVLMTDGANTRSQDSPTSAWHEGTDGAAADGVSAELCANIKKDAITLYVVSFALPDTSANEMLAACASSGKHFFIAETAEDLAGVFTEIGTQVAQLRLTK